MKRAIRIIAPVSFLLATIGCSGSVDKNFISSAVVETQTYEVATTIAGTLVELYKDEGQATAAGELVAVVDTVPIVFKIREAEAGMAELQANIAAKQGEISSQESDIKGVDREYKRIGDLADKGSAPTQQKDNLETQLSSAKLRVNANRMVLSSLYKHLEGVKIQIAEAKDQLGRCYVHSPIGGTVLTKYKNRGEVVLPGNPIVELGRYDTMQVDFYIPQTLLSGFKLGQTVRIRLDDRKPEKGRKEVFAPALVTWISNDAEFSPKNIQTRESRNELVFKIRALAANPNGVLKRGWPVEVWR